MGGGGSVWAGRGLVGGGSIWKPAAPTFGGSQSRKGVGWGGFLAKLKRFGFDLETVGEGPGGCLPPQTVSEVKLAREGCFVYRGARDLVMESRLGPRPCNHRVQALVLPAGLPDL